MIHRSGRVVVDLGRSKVGVARVDGVAVLIFFLVILVNLVHQFFELEKEKSQHKSGGIKKLAAGPFG